MNDQLRTFCYNFHVTPTDANPELKKVSGAYAVIMVTGPDMDTAQTKAMHYLALRHWHICGQEEAEVMTEENAAGDERYAVLYAKAQLHGIGLLLSAWPHGDDQ